MLLSKGPKTDSREIGVVRNLIQVFFVLSLCALIAACGGGGGTVVPGPGPNPSPSSGPAVGIQHIVIIFQENRTVDNLFNGFPHADTVLSGKNSSGGMTTLQPISLAAPYDLDHSHLGFTTEYNSGAMNGFDKEGISPQPGFTPPANAAYGYVPQSETGPYFALAQQFTFADEMFQTNEGPSFPAHQYIISGTSAPAPGSSLLASENVSFPKNVSHANQGCDSPAGSTVALIDPSGNESSTMFPCFDHQTLPDLLDAKGISWKYYTPLPYFLWSGPDAISHLRYGKDWANVSIPETNIFNDINLGQLPAVSWVIPTGSNSDHANNNSSAGPSWVGDVANAIGTSKYWNNTVIFVTWDDWGGWYDHVTPHVYNSYELGFRVPLIVISPYARAGYVSHVPHEFASILHFTEKQFALGSLGYTDARADDLSDCFNFSQSPLPYHPVTLRYSHAQLMSRWQASAPDSN
jgi:phospholipase C